VLIELFFARCYGWGATSDYRFKIGDFAPTGAGWPKISGKRGRPHQPFFSQKTRLNYLSCGIKIWTALSSVLSQYTRVTDGRTDGRTDGQTDRILIALPRLHCMQRGKN